MPELLEIEYYRRAAAGVVGRTISGVEASDAWYLKGGATAPLLESSVVGRRVLAVRRHGKLLLFDTSGPVLGLRFGMTGRLVVDGRAAIERLEYGSSRDVAGWCRFALRFRGTGGALRILDPRRLGGVELDPDESALGPDAWSITEGQLRGALAVGIAPVKARLLDQHAVAGIGNLLADETLWRAAIDPARPASSLDRTEVRRLHRALRRVLDQLFARGGSHTGDLHHARERGARCPLDGTELLRRTIGGRTTYSCPVHQR